MQQPEVQSVGVSTFALLASTTTLVCCVLPAALVAVGAGASLAALVTAVPQLVWLSAHKAGVFGIALLLLVSSGVLLRRSRHLPCPADARLAASCQRLRRANHWIFLISALLFSLAAIFAYLIPALR